MTTRHHTQLHDDASTAAVGLDPECIAYFRGECCWIEPAIRDRNVNRLSGGEVANRRSLAVGYRARRHRHVDQAIIARGAKRRFGTYGRRRRCDRMSKRSGNNEACAEGVALRWWRRGQVLRASDEREDCTNAPCRLPDSR